MTKDELFTLVAQHESKKLVEAAVTMSETDRKKLSTTASSILRAIEKSSWQPSLNAKDKEILQKLRECGAKLNRSHVPLETSRLAAFAFCPFTAVKSLGIYHYENKGLDLYTKVLVDRRPDWIDAWVLTRLGGDWPNISWTLLRDLIKKGICKKPDVDEYAQLFAGGLWHYLRGDKKSYSPISQQLRDDPELMEDELWRLFRCDTTAFHGEFEYMRIHAPKNFESWPEALKKLAADGTIDRQRLLDESLAGLTTGFKNNTLSGFGKFFEVMEPTIDEQVARQGTFGDLLSSNTPHVVTFAIKQLKAIAKAKKLDGIGFINAAPSVFSVRTKTQPKGALTLLKQVAQRDKKLLGPASAAACEAFGHESADVQEAGLKLIEQWQSKLDDAAKQSVADAIAARLDDIASAHRTRAQQVLSDLGVSVESVADLHAVDEGELDDLEKELQARAQSLDSHWAELGGVKAAVEAIAEGTTPPPLNFDAMEVPLLSGLETVEPIASFEELLEFAAHCVELTEDAMQIERLLDGIGRFCDQYPKDFDTITGPLKKRITDGAGSATKGLLHAGNLGLRQLLVCWLFREPYTQPPDPHGYYTSNDIVAALDHRCMELGERVHARKAAPLLAMPTHGYGWIDPRALVRRALTYQQSEIDVPVCDLIHALIRLPGDHRDEALQLSKQVTGDVGDALRWALGGSTEPKVVTNKPSAVKAAAGWLRRLVRKDDDDEHEHDHHVSLWLAAGRARQPRGELVTLKQKRIVDDRPDGTDSSQYTWKATLDKKKHYSFPRVEISDGEWNHKKRAPLRPTIVLHMSHGRYSPIGYMSAAGMEWVGMIWPANTDAYHMASTRGLMMRVDDKASSFEPYHAFLRCLFQPDMLWTEMANLTWWMAAVGRDADSRGLAIDAIIEAIQDGRAHPQPLADVLIQLAKGGWLKLNRLAETLAEVARVSSLHQWVIAEILLRFIPSMESMPRDVHHVLALLLDQLTDLGMVLDHESESKLKAIKGTSKTAKLAKSLVALEVRSVQSQSQSQSQRQAMLDLLQGRIERVERWC